VVAKTNPSDVYCDYCLLDWPPLSRLWLAGWGDRGDLVGDYWILLCMIGCFKVLLRGFVCQKVEI